jgi:hypothetical protein
MVRIGYDAVTIFIAWVICAVGLFVILSLLIPEAWVQQGETSVPGPNFAWMCVAVAYVMISALLGLRIVRDPMIRWYGSQDWYTFGKSATDVFFKNVSRRIGFECLIITLSCVISPIGGWLVSILSRSKKPLPQREETRSGGIT